MRRARIYYHGAEIWVPVDEAGNVVLPHGSILEHEEVAWLPPVTRGATIFALGLNYADHNKELGFAAQRPVPLVFLKGPASCVGHRGRTPRPADANQMHPECELVAVIGRPARRVREEDALEYVGGYTVANDYAIREYLENYYRPNARVKNRTATTPVGPWIVDASDVPDPQKLSLETIVNGETVQSGTTAEMILGVAGLVAYLSDVVTLMPGDMILTGTPHGLRFVEDGDRVESRIEGIGTLVNHVVGVS